MKARKQVSRDKHEKLNPDTIKMLFRNVFPYMSNLVIFNLAHFCVGESTDADRQFSESLHQELFRRGLLTAPDFYLGDVIVDKFTDEDLDSVNIWFACDPEEPTTEDHYLELFTGRDRWAERNIPKQKPRAAKKIVKDRTKPC